MRRISFFRFLFGENEFSASSDDATRLLNLFMDYRVVYRDFMSEDDRVTFRCSSYSSLIITRLCRKNGIELTKTYSRGIPPALYRYRKRAGLFVGALIAAALLFIYDDYVWDITVSGNETVTYSEVVEALENHGLSVGSVISELNVDRIKTAVMVDDDRIAWMAINVEGTVAHVQIRENEKANGDTPKKPANVVAALDGQIEKVEVFRGSAAVISGQAVRKGDILISGIKDLKTGGFSVTRANGRVYAITERTFRVEIPYEYEQKNYEKAEIKEISVIFFGKIIKVLKINGNNGEFCDTIDRVDMIDLPGGNYLPFGIKRVESIPYSVTDGRYTADEAMELAYYRLEQDISASVPDAQILSKKIESEIGEDSYVLICTVRCIEDIAETVEFEADLR